MRSAMILEAFGLNEVECRDSHILDLYYFFKLQDFFLYYSFLLLNLLWNLAAVVSTTFFGKHTHEIMEAMSKGFFEREHLMQANLV